MKASILFAALFALSPIAAQAEKFEAGSLLVESHGSKGSPMIFVPGLSSGPYVWDAAVAEFEKEHVVYVVTLPGFDGRPAVKGDLIAAAQKSIEELIAARKLAKPVLVGHSLGATLSIAYAESHADQIGGVVAIDGMPVFPGTENMPASQRPAVAASIKARMAGMSQQAFADGQKAYMRSFGGAIDTAKADALAERSAKSDPEAVAEYASQLTALDLRAALPSIKVPVLVISPFNDADMKAAGMNMTAEGKAAYYKGLMAGTPKLDIVSVAPARHFAMIDQPQQVNDAIRNYLKSL